MTGHFVRCTLERGRLCAALILGAAHAISASSLAAQGIRANAVSTTRYIEIRPIKQDTVPRSSVVELPDGSFEFEGRPVFCVTVDYCVFYRSLDIEHAVVFVQDFDFTAWNLGLRGLSVTAALRGRTRLNGDFVWPRSNDEVDAILAYAELQLDPLRVRLGRQQTTGGLGFSGYDGASALAELTPWLTAEAYGGRSLAKSLYEPRNEALRGVEDFVPDRAAYLIGGWLEIVPSARTALAVRYQREIWSNRSALLSERASFDAQTELLAPVTVTAAADYDFAFGRIGKAHVTARTTVSKLTLAATVRRYLPYFELWTIWGYFSPSAYHEAELQAGMRAGPRLAVQASAAWRQYADAEAPIVFSRLEDQSKRVNLGASYQPMEKVTLLGEYLLEIGYGAFLSSGDVSVRWQPHSRIMTTVAGTAFQQIEQFRVGEGVVLGASASVDAEISNRIGIGAGASLYRQRYDNRPSSTDWNQRRGWIALRLSLGSDPGIPLRAAP